MNIKLRKRIIGFLLLIGLILILVPMLFNRSVSLEQLKLSGNVPPPPEKPDTMDVPIPAQSPSTLAPLPASTPIPVPQPLVETASIPIEKKQINPIVMPQAPNMPLQSGHNLAADAPPAVAPAISTASTSAPTTIYAEPPHPVVATKATETTTAHSASSSEMPSLQKTTAKKVVTLSSKKPEKKESPQKIASSSSHNTETWSVQVGTFAHKDNAAHLLNKLKSHGFLAYLTTLNTKKGDFLKVMVSAGSNKVNASKICADIQKKFHIQGSLIQPKATPAAP